jgi:hypothetical protein
VHGQINRLADLFIQTLEQGSATGKEDTTFGDIGGKLGSSTFKQTLDGIDHCGDCL